MILSLVTNPFIAKNMSPEDYAIVGYYTAFNALFTPLINFYLLHYYTKRFYELNSQERERLKSTLFKSLIFFSLFVFFIALAIVFIYVEMFNRASKMPFWPYAVMSMLPVPMLGIYNLTLVDYRMSRDSGSFFKMAVFNGAILTTFSLLFVVFFKMGAIGKLGSSIVTSLLFFTFLLYKNRDVWKCKFDWNFFFDALKFCWPLVMASMLTFFSNGYDKIVLERNGDIAMLGIYSVGVSIANYLHIFSTSINDTFQPDIFENIVKRNFPKVAKYIGVKLIIMSICVIGFIVFAPFLVRVLTFGRYVASTRFAIIVSLSTITSMLYYSFSQVTVALGYTSITLINKIFGSVVSVVSFTILINKYGSVGAAWGLVLSYIYFFIGNVTLVFIKYNKERKNENRNTDISSTN